MKIFSLIIVSCLLMMGCGNSGENKPVKQTVLKVVSDDSFVKVMDAELDSFNYIEKRDSAVVFYAPEADCFDMLLKDSVRMIVATRDLNDKEKAFFKKKDERVFSTPIFTDAVAIILHPENKDSSFNSEDLKRIFSGEAKTWADLEDGNSKEPIQVVFDNNRSSTTRFILERFLGKVEKYEGNFYSVKSSRGVIDHVSRTKNAIGVISVNWISDFDDKEVQVFHDKVKVASIKNSDGKLVPPYQAFIAQQQYPLTRTVYLIRVGGGPGIGTRFVNFVTGVANMPGQLIVQKAGLMPVRGHVRIVNLQ